MSRPTALLLVPFLAAVAGSAVAVLGGLAVVAWIDATPAPATEPWADLGRFLLLSGLAVLVGLAVWVVLLVRAARRLFPAGHRGLPVGGSLGQVLGGWALLLAAGTLVVQLGAAGPGPGRTSTTLAVLLVAAGPSLVFRWADRRVVAAGR